jgi:hypothetical protein
MLTPPEAPGEGMTRLSAQAEVAGLVLEVVRGRQGRQGQRVLVPWEVLLPMAQSEIPLLPVPSWEGSPLYARPTPLSKSAGERASLQARPLKKTDLRNGPIGIIGQRPGRDTAMPALRPVLGLPATGRLGR